jgi:hypothetical protein
MLIEGRCHCGNIAYRLEWEGEDRPVARACGCTFCVKHGAAWTSNPRARLDVRLREPAAVSVYRFGSGTADFRICTRCGVVPLVTCPIEGGLYAVVNVSTFSSLDPATLARSAVSFEGEATGQRLARRMRNWIGGVRIGGP